METICIKVLNWEKYNPRTDRKAHHWFRMEFGIAMEPKFFGLSAGQKFAVICLFAEYGRSRSAAAQKASKALEGDDLFLRSAAAQLRSAAAQCLNDVHAKIYIDHFAHLVGISSDEIRSTISHLSSLGVVSIEDEKNPVSTGHQTVSPGVPTVTYTNTKKNTSVAVQRRDPTGDYFRAAALGLSKEEVERQVLEVYPNKAGFQRAWQSGLKTHVLDKADGLETVLRACKNFREHMRQLKRPPDKIKNFATFWTDGSWLEYEKGIPVQEGFDGPSQVTTKRVVSADGVINSTEGPREERGSALPEILLEQFRKKLRTGGTMPEDPPKAP